MKRSELKRTIPLRKKAVAKRRRPAIRCSWSNRCKRRPSIKVDQGPWPFPEQLFCKTHATTVADTLVGNYVKERDGQCQSCGKTDDLEWAHVISRGARFIRWDPDNSMALCRADHFRFTQSPAAWAVFLEEKWPGRYLRLVHKEIEGERRGGSVDVAAVIEVFRSVAA